MDLAVDLKTDRHTRIEKRTKQTFSAKKSVLAQNNYYSNQELEEGFVKTQSRQEVVDKEDKCLDKDLDNDKCLKANTVFEDLIALLSKKLNLSNTSDPIHDKYKDYFRQTAIQKDLDKTDYTYIRSYSYKRHIDLSKIFDWVIPNMSRRTISSVKSMTSSTTSSSAISGTISMSTNSNSTNELTNSAESSRNSRARTPSTLQMFTRSQCAGGAQCEAPDCDIHNKKKKRNAKSSGILIPNSGPGLVPEFEFSDDDEYYNVNNMVNQQRLSSYRRNGSRVYDGTEDSEEEEEEITYIKKITNIFRTTINNTYQTIDAALPKPIKTMTNKCLSPWFLWPFLLVLLAVPSYRFIQTLSNDSKSSLWSNRNIETLTGDIADPSFRQAMSQMAEQLSAMRSELSSLKNSNNKLNMNSKDKWTDLSAKIDSIETYFNEYMKDCCKNQTDYILSLIDGRLTAFMSRMLSDTQTNRQSLSPSEAAEELKNFVRMELSKTNDDFRESVEQRLMLSIEAVENRMNQQKSDHSSSNITIDEIKSLISQALAMYDADKTGQPDFALEPAGGTIVNTRCSETYDPYGVQYRIFGVPVWSSSVSPRAVIQPTISPGECWAFRGSTGYLVIKLSQPITPTGFSYEHIPKQISRDGNIDSAPKEFQVRGLDDESDTSGHLLGNYVYEDNGRPMQYFDVQDPNPRVFTLIELVVLSNQGHHEYTCLYRFRVHGKKANH